jgi:tripartite-type tricarboxylate transporter receptor subunit TctC
VAELNAVVNQLLKQPDMQSELKAQAITPEGSTVDEFAVLIHDEITKWNKIITTGAVKAN